ncbi:hypothetical protein [Schumannella luteola]
MKVLRARDALAVFRDGEEVPGIHVYGLRVRHDPRVALYPSEVWDTTGEPTRFTLYGDNWEVLLWAVPLRKWPRKKRMAAALRATMSRMIDSGCRVAWVAAEGFPFCDPPMLFDPACMSDSVLAWMDDSGRGWFDLDPDRPIAPVSEDVVQSLRKYSAGLSDVE